MTPLADTSNIIDRTKRVTATATTLVAFLLPPTAELLPSQYYALSFPSWSGYRWEVEENRYVISEIPDELMEHDTFISMPPKDSFSVRLRIKNISKGEPSLVLPEA